jgi:hypothetical protein
LRRHIPKELSEKEDFDLFFFFFRWVGVPWWTGVVRGVELEKRYFCVGEFTIDILQLHENDRLTEKR